MRAAYDELQISSRRREKLEWSARRRMETEIERLQDNNRQLEGKKVLSLKRNVYGFFQGVIIKIVLPYYSTT